MLNLNEKEKGRILPIIAQYIYDGKNIGYPYIQKAVPCFVTFNSMSFCQDITNKAAIIVLGFLISFYTCTHYIISAMYVLPLFPFA